MDTIKSKIFESFNGVLLVKKEPLLSSFGVIKKIKKVFF